MKVRTLIIFLAISNFCLAEAISYADIERIVKEDLSNINMALEIYYLDHDKYPDENNGISSLIWMSPSNQHAYLKGWPHDPWRNNYQYSTTPCAHAFSLGADGKLGGSGENRDIHFECKSGS